MCRVPRAHTASYRTCGVGAPRNLRSHTRSRYFSFFISLSSTLACTTRFLNVLSIRDVPRIKKESPSLPFSPFAKSSVRLPLGVRVSFHRARRRSLSPALALLLSRISRLSFPRILCIPPRPDARVSSPSRKLLPSSASPLPPSRGTRPFSYNGDDRRLFVHFRAASRRTGPT